MPPPALRRSLAAATLCLVTLTGCGGGLADPDSDPSPAEPTTSSATPDPSTATPSPTEAMEPTPTATPTPTPTPTSAPSGSSSGSPSPTASDAPGASGLRGRLLAGSDLPGFNEQYRWTTAATGPERSEEPVGTCQRFGVTSIGAERAVVRRYRPVDRRAAGTDDAAQLVAEFPDELTARRAFSVLEAWRRGCAQRLSDYRTARVGPVEPVAVPSGRAQWYLLTYGPVRGDATSQFFDAQGTALAGTRIAMVTIRLAGQDYNYERGSEPMVEALRRAAARLS